MAKKRKALGRGIDALIGTTLENNNNILREIEIDKIIPNKEQPRKSFKENTIKELAESIKSKGVLEPIIVKKINNEKFELIIGERRWRAAQIAGIKKIPAIIRDIDPNESLEIALIENLQREDLNPIEIALSYKLLIEKQNLKHDELAKKIGKSRTSITNTIRLLKLPKQIQQMIIDKKITEGHARALLHLEKEKDMIALANKITKENISVRETEKIIYQNANVSHETKQKNNKKRENTSTNDPYIEDIKSELMKTLGTKIDITYQEGRGKIIISFYNEEDFNRIIEIISTKQDFI